MVVEEEEEGEEPIEGTVFPRGIRKVNPTYSCFFSFLKSVFTISLQYKNEE